MKFADFAIPSSLEEALALLREKSDTAFPVAGATALQYLGDMPEKTAVDITRLGLSGIQPTDSAFQIGATTTLAEAVSFTAPGWVLGHVARKIPTQQIRNISTVGGNICRVFPWSDLPVALLAMEATIVVQGENEERVSASDYFKTQPRNLLRGGKLVTSVEVPAVAEPAGFSYQKFNVTNMAFSVMSACAIVTVKNDKVTRARLSVGAAIPSPHRMLDAEAAMKGKAATVATVEAAIAVASESQSWKGQQGMTDEYVTHLARVVMKDALMDAMAGGTGS